MSGTGDKKTKYIYFLFYHRPSSHFELTHLVQDNLPHLMTLSLTTLAKSLLPYRLTFTGSRN